MLGWKRICRLENNGFTRLYGMLGFAMRAGKIILGADRVASALPEKGNGAVRLVLLAADASDGTKKRLTYKCEFYKKEIIVIPLKAEELGARLGKLFAPAVLAITDDRFAEEIKKSLG